MSKYNWKSLQPEICFCQRGKLANTDQSVAYRIGVHGGFGNEQLKPGYIYSCSALRHVFEIELIQYLLTSPAVRVRAEIEQYLR